jgi:DDE superfamily endonuclease
VNVQVITDPGGRLLWLSPALPGRTHDLTTARTHRIIRICERQGVPILADLAYQGGGPWLTTGIKRRPLQELTPTERTVNRALAAARAPVERGVARPKSWRIFRRARCSPNLLMMLSSRLRDGEVALVALSVTEKSPQNVHSSAGEGEDGLSMPFTFGTFAFVEAARLVAASDTD